MGAAQVPEPQEAVTTDRLVLINGPDSSSVVLVAGPESSLVIAAQVPEPQEAVRRPPLALSANLGETRNE